jgi:hypothetical protein
MTLEEQFEVELNKLAHLKMWPLLSHGWAKHALAEAIKNAGDSDENTRNQHIN